MCGVAGSVRQGLTAAEWQGTLRAMTEALRHRGPDDGDLWYDSAAGIGLGHRRLSVIDLSETGRQPMASRSGRYVVTYNGEVYNFHALRRKLVDHGVSFRGTSDTEVILAALEQWGVEEAIGRFIGMFAFGLWDREARALYLVRDRLGIKPLYYGWIDATFVFASELKALAALPEFAREIDRDALAMYLQHNCVPSPRSIYKGIFKLVPGCLLRLDAGSSRPSGDFSPDPDDPAAAWKPVRYWSALRAAEDGGTNPLRVSEDEAVQEFDALLRDAVRQRMHADVPLGAFLSGGIDSSIVVAMMQAESTLPVRTFSIGFPETAYNEAEHAKRVAGRLGTEHSELYVDPGDALKIIPTLPAMFDEPFADSSQVPVALVCRLARRHVTVSLSGDGGDEVFAGYERYYWAKAVWEKAGWIPRGVRRTAAGLVRVCGVRTWTALAERLSRVLPARLQRREAGEQLYRLADALGSRDPLELYLRLVSHWPNGAGLVRGARPVRTEFTRCLDTTRLNDVLDRLMYLDIVTYLPDDLLVKLDRASMAVGLEARTPLLDHRIVEFAWRLPHTLKTRDGQGKWLLRKLLARYLPVELFDRPKMGFGVPLGTWLRGPLRDWAEHLLDESRLRRQGFFNPEPIREKWREHLSGQRNWHYHLWDVLMFQAWLERWHPTR